MKKQQQAGKKLTRSQMQAVKGGAAAGIKCTVNADCPGPCTITQDQGYYCVNWRCIYLYCA